MFCGGIKIHINHIKEMAGSKMSFIVLDFQATIGLTQEKRQGVKGEAKPEGA
jgi:hypothetical protein